MQKEINKLLKRISAEKLKNNNKECIELYNIVAGLYSDIGSFDEAIHYHEKALDISKTLGDRLNTAICLRYVGEAKASAGQFYQAIDFIKRYLDLAQKEDNKVEIQRAWTTLGRVYLMQAQDMKDSSNIIDNRIKEVAREAEKRFQTALNLAESVREEVGEKEFSQMTSGLLVNIGLIKDICGQHTESVQKLMRAIEICKSAKLKEDLYRCQVILSSIFRQKWNIKMATKVSEEALVTAKQIGKKLLICDAYIERGLVRLWQRDFKEAKRSFAQAYLEKSPSEEDHTKAIRLTKLAYLISTTYDKISKDNEANQTRLRLCDKLGDLFIAVNCYTLAVEFYKRAYLDARICSRPKSEIAKILYSVAETYADNGQFEHAMACYQKELSYRNGNDKEQCQSLIKIAHMHEYLEHDAEKVCLAYEKAYEKAGKDPKLMYNVLKDYVPYMKKKSYNLTRCSSLEETLLNVQSYPDIMAEIEAEEDEDVANDLEDEVANVDDVITDDEDNDEVLMVGRRRARGAKKFKPNEVGDTPLHEACIKGDMKRVKSLLEQGHEVNPRDNAGWIPLHEACNHGHYGIAEFLIENGADVSNRGLKGTSPLHDAATNGHYDIMRLLIKNGANVIALTDSGETVLSCLRDFKNRNLTNLSDRALTDYKHMETELLNLMDKCGFNLMDTNTKNLGSSRPSTSSAALKIVAPKPRNNMALETNPVKDYRAAIGTMKRKRFSPELNEKVSLPATYHTGANTSAATKDWLIDDVSRQKTRSNLKELVELVDDDDDDASEGEVEITAPSPASSSCANKKILFDSDEAESTSITNERNSMRSQNSFVDLTRNTPPSITTENFIPNSSSLINDNSFRPFRMTEENQQLINVLIDEHRLEIPIKEPENATIAWLKESVAERFSSLHGVYPNLSLSPENDPKCVYFEKDLCVDVVRTDVRAKIMSWQLEPISEVYEKKCRALNIEPMSFIKSECKLVEYKNNLLDLSYTYWPRKHVKPATEAFAWRDFTIADLTCAGSMIFTELDGKDVLESMATWKKITTVSLRAVGLIQSHFVDICSMMKLPELKSLDLSFNSITFVDKTIFKEHIEKLLKGCPKLKRIDMRENILEFVHTLPDYEKNNYNLAKTLGLTTKFGSNIASDLEILGADQKDYEIYAYIE